jgi:hypothetical protein
LEFEVGDNVYLRVSLVKGVCHFDSKGKLAPRYISPYPIIDKYGPTSYQVELPSKLLGVHNVFHVSQLKGCLKPLTNVVVEDTIPLEPNLTNKTESHATRLLDFRRYNGMITLKTKPHGNMKTSCNPTTLSSSHQGNNPTLLVFLASIAISG